MPREPIPLDEEELDTILAIARNKQSGRITEREVIELVRVYSAALAERAMQEYGEQDAEQRFNDDPNRHL